MTTTDVGRLFAVLLATGAMAAACGGKVGGPTTSPTDGGTGVFPGDGGGSCIDVHVSSFDVSCSVDTDCVAIATGTLCSDTCYACGVNAAINASSQAAYEADLSPLSGGEACPCVSDEAPRCFSGACVLCSLDPNAPTQPPGCQEENFDGGSGDDTGCLDCGDDTSTDDTGSGDDTGGGDDTGASDGGTCVFVDPTTFDTTCNVNSDCIVIQTGTVCDGSCDCGGTPVNIDGQSQYDQDTKGIVFAGCPCAATLPPACSGGICIACNGSTNDPPACGDEGG